MQTPIMHFVQHVSLNSLSLYPVLDDIPAIADSNRSADLYLQNSHSTNS